MGNDQGIRTTHGRGRLFDSVLDTIGDTPVIRVNNIPTKGATIYVKAEAFNPGGSVKDRLAVNIIEAAERSGALKPGQTVVEATSGNTGIALAFVAAVKANADAGGEGGVDPPCPERCGHVQKGRGSGQGTWLVSGCTV